MKLREHEAKNVLKAAGIPVPAGFLIKSPDELTPHLAVLGDAFVLKAQVVSPKALKAGVATVTLTNPAGDTLVYTITVE